MDYDEERIIVKIKKVELRHELRFGAGIPVLHYRFICEDLDGKVSIFDKRMSHYEKNKYQFQRISLGSECTIVQFKYYKLNAHSSHKEYLKTELSEIIKRN